MVNPEGDICSAAIKYKDLVIIGWRHANIRNEIVEKFGATKEEMQAIMSDPWKVGFITENGRFLTRSQALLYGRQIGQIDTIIGSELTSEDLWDSNGN